MLGKKLQNDILKISADEYVQKRYTETKMSLALIASEVSNVTANATSSLQENSNRLTLLVDKFEKTVDFFVEKQLTLVGKKRISSKRKSRIILFDYIMPTFSIIFVIVAFLIPNSAKHVSNLIGV